MWSVVFWLLPLAVSAQSNTGCSIHYQTQPLEQITCNPYNNLNNVLRLGCNTYSSNITAYEIRWYRALSTANSSLEQLTSKMTGIRVTANTRMKGASQMSRLRIRNLNENDTGVYWCQIAILEGNVTIKLLPPSQKTKLQPPEFYSELLPCPYSFLDEATVRCATEPLDTPSQVTSNTLLMPSATRPTYSSSNSLMSATPEAHPTISATIDTTPVRAVSGHVLYGVIATVGCVLVACIITVVLIGVICHRKHRRQKASQEGHDGTIQEIHTQTHENMGEHLRRPISLPDSISQNGFSLRLSVAREPSNDSQYTEVPNRSRKCGAGRLLCRHDAIGTVSPDLEDPHHYKTPTATKMIQDGHVYHTVDPNERSDPSYTSLSPSTTTCLAVHLPERPRHLRLPLTTSGSYTNDVIYQGLSPQTQDYISLYATAEKKEQDGLADST